MGSEGLVHPLSSFPGTNQGPDRPPSLEGPGVRWAAALRGRSRESPNQGLPNPHGTLQATNCFPPSPIPTLVSSLFLSLVWGTRVLWDWAEVARLVLCGDFFQSARASMCHLFWKPHRSQMTPVFYLEQLLTLLPWLFHDSCLRSWRTWGSAWMPQVAETSSNFKRKQ